jgi:hypothetical protein
MNKIWLSIKQKTEHLNYWHLFFGTLFLLSVFMAFVINSNTINGLGLIMIFAFWGYFEFNRKERMITKGISFTKRRFMEFLSLLGFFVLVFIPWILVYAHKPGELFKIENYTYYSQFNPYPYESGLPSNLKRLVVYTDGKMSSIEEFIDHKKVFYKNFNIYDNNQVNIQAFLLNDSDEILKIYRLDNNSISIDTFFSNSYNEIIEQNTFYVKDSLNSTLFNFENLTYEELIQEKWLTPFRASLKQGEKIVYETNSIGQKVKETTFDIYGDSAKVSDYQYNNNRQIQSCYGRFCESKLTNKIVFKYDPDLYYKGTSNNKLSSYTWEQIGQSNMIIYSIKYIHNKEGMLIQDIVNMDKVETKTIYEYDTKGRITTEKSLQADGLAIDIVIKYFYNSEGYILKKQTEDSTGTIIEEKTYRYTLL